MTHKYQVEISSLLTFRKARGKRRKTQPQFSQRTSGFTLDTCTYVLSTEDFYTAVPHVSVVLSSHLLFKGTLDGCSQGVLDRGQTAFSVKKDTWKIHCMIYI